MMSHDENLDGLFRNNGSAGMLEDSEYEKTDMVSSFLGAFMEQCCRQSDTAPAIGVPTTYRSVLNMLHRRKL